MLPALPASAATPKPKVGQPAPDAELTLIDDTVVRLSELRGNVVVLNLWATWCIPCRKELPILDRYYQIQKQHGLRVFALTLDNNAPRKTMAKLFDVLSIQPTSKIIGPYRPIDNGVPSNYVIDRAGVLRYAKAGAFDLNDLNRELVPLLQQPRPA